MTQRTLGAIFYDKSVSAGMDMALAVIARLFGKPKAQEIADATEYEWHTDATQDPFVQFLNKAMQGGGA
jgi:transcriptional regulator GlxA family with amidase domain